LSKKEEGKRKNMSKEGNKDIVLDALIC